MAATRTPMKVPRSSFGNTTITAEMAATLTQAPQVRNRPIANANIVTFGMTG
jgi:hypothetical protein